MFFRVLLPVPRFVRESRVLLTVWRVVAFVVLSAAASGALVLLLRGCAVLIE